MEDWMYLWYMRRRSEGRVRALTEGI